MPSIFVSFKLFQRKLCILSFLWRGTNKFEHVCIIYRDVSVSGCVYERVVVTAEKNPDCRAERRMMDEQVAASKPPLLEWSHTNTPHLPINLAVSRLHCLTHIQYTLPQSVWKRQRRAGEREREVRNKRWRDVRERGDKHVARLQNHSVSERACVLMSVSMCVPPGIPPLLFLPSCHGNHHPYACVHVFGECEVNVEDCRNCIVHTSKLRSPPQLWALRWKLKWLPKPHFIYNPLLLSTPDPTPPPLDNHSQFEIIHGLSYVEQIKDTYND